MADANVIVKNTEIGPVKRALSLRERQSLQAAASVFAYGQMNGEGQYVPGAQGAAPVAPSFFRVNRPRLSDQQKEIVKILKEQAPEPVEAKDRDRLEKHRKILEAQIKPYLQTRGEVHVTAQDDPRYMRALDKAKAWHRPQEELGYIDPSNKKLGFRTPEHVAQDWMNLSRRLEPEDENFDKLDRLRDA